MRTTLYPVRTPQRRALVSKKTPKQYLDRLLQSQDPIAIMPRPLVQAPIWRCPREAAGEAARTYSYLEPYTNRNNSPGIASHRVTTTNALPLGEPGSGLLRYHDLDVAMALSWPIANGEENAVIRLPQAMRLMGYRTLSQRAYATVHESLIRLSSVQVRFGDHTSNGRAPLVHIFDEAQIQPSQTGGRAQEICVIPSAWWRKTISQGGWQAIDIDAYLTLRQVYPGKPLARLMFAYLASCRASGTNSFVTPP